MALTKEDIVMPDIFGIDTSGEEFHYIQDHLREFDAVYQLLGDEKSKKVYAIEADEGN